MMKVVDVPEMSYFAKDNKGEVLFCCSLIIIMIINTVLSKTFGMVKVIL